ncbi:MAG TPA: nucleotide-binding protein [Rhodanobacter sp.]|nr:nucleotide-binding protein [Rhodanobacter sp.]
MKLSRYIPRTRFTVEVLKEATETLFRDVKEDPNYWFNVGLPEGTWTHDNQEEYFADYRRATHDTGVYVVRAADHRLSVQSLDDVVLVQVEAPNGNRALVLSTFDVFERNRAACALPPPVSKKKPVVFIGHGRSGLWKSLKDHLTDQHGYSVEAFENGARAGHTIRDVLHSMMENSSFALLVMTGEDATTDGGLRARQNVVHEAGLFQGKLGFERAIVLLEEGVEEFSNIHGITQIRFSKGNIRETYGDVLATLRREFPPAK